MVDVSNESSRVRVEVQYVEGCPNAVSLIEGLGGRDEVELVLTIVGGDGPVPVGFAGSPTVLIDGSNPLGQVSVDAPSCAVRPPTLTDVEAVVASLR
jgi:formaldehyde-activating enzyme involved in methanogenesis